MLEPVFNDDLVYKFKRIIEKAECSDQFKQVIKRYKKLDTTWLSCDNLHDRLHTQSPFIAMVSSLMIIPQWSVRPQTR